MRLPTAKTLLRLGIDQATAQAVRKAMERAYSEEDMGGAHSRAEYALSLADEILQAAGKTHGLEYIRHKDDTMHDVFGLDYLNTGDPYYTTIMFNHLTGTFQVGAWGDIVEASNKYE